MDHARAFSRVTPFGMLVLASVLLGLHHLFVRTRGQYIALAMFGLPMLWMVALGGTIYPPVFYAISHRGRALPLRLKIAAAGLAFIGFCIAFYLTTILY